MWQNSLHGCELMDIVNGAPPFRLKQTHVRDCRVGIKLMREIEVVLLYHGVGDIIAPKNPHADTTYLSFMVIGTHGASFPLCYH